MFKVKQRGGKIMIKKHEVNVYVPIQKCYDLLLDQGREKPWKIMKADPKNFTMKWYKGAFLWTPRVYLSISLEALNDYETYACFTFENPRMPRPVDEHFRESDFERVIKRFDERVAEFTGKR
jgi:hypothetical protein